MSTRDKIILLSALVIIVGGALTINGRFDAENTTRLNEEQPAGNVSIPRQRALEVRGVDPHEDARNAVSIININNSEPAAQIRQVEPDSGVDGIRASVQLPGMQGAALAAEPKPETIAQVQQQPAIAEAATGGSYVVKRGQTLTHIAIEVYQDRENAVKNAQKIYEMNKDILSSMDRVREGQELRIPPVAHGGQLSRLAQLAAEYPNALKPAGSEQSQEIQGKIYTVKNGDNLWKIAEQTLGKGHLYKKIVDANQDVLSNESRLSPGMTILIPNG